MEASVKKKLDEWVEQYNRKEFILNDPISIPHQFTHQPDIEIIGLWIAVLSWGNRQSIIRSGEKLITLLEGEPHRFILEHREKDLKRFLTFVHRTFQPTDALYFIYFFKNYFENNSSLETAFYQDQFDTDLTTERMLIHFHQMFFDNDFAPARSRKHIATPAAHSACKRLNMFLRWMVRKDQSGVDFGVWKKIKVAQLVCPLDVHVGRVARMLGLLHRQQNDWLAALELTSQLRKFDHCDPVKYDFALFGAGVLQKAPHLLQTR